MRLFNILSILLFSFIQLQVQAQNSKTPDTDKLLYLEIYFEGFFQDTTDELSFNLKGDFKIVKEKNQLYGISNTNLHHGTEKVEPWKTLLNEKELLEIWYFIEQLDKTPNRVDVPGYYNFFYTAKVQEHEWYIKPDRNIFGDFKTDPLLVAPDIGFYMGLFEEEMETYIKNQKIHIEKVNKQLMRKWYYSPVLFDSLQQGSILKFSSTASEENNEYWEIMEGFEFVQSSGPVTESNPSLIIYYNIQVGISDFMYMSIYQPDLLNRTDEQNDFPGHTSFYIISLNEDEMTLKIAY